MTVSWSMFSFSSGSPQRTLVGSRGFETAPAPPRKPQGWGALEKRIGPDRMAALDGDMTQGVDLPSRRWPGVMFRVSKDGSVVALVESDVELARATAPVYPRGNGDLPPWPEVVLGRLLLLDRDETLLFGDGALGGVEPIARSVRLRDEA